MFVSVFRKGIQLAFGNVISLDMYKLFFQLLSQGVVWLGILLLILMSLLPDIIFMLIGRHFYPSETQKVQVTVRLRTDSSSMGFLCHFESETRRPAYDTVYYAVHRGHYMPARGYEFYLRVFNSAHFGDIELNTRR